MKPKTFGPRPFGSDGSVIYAYVRFDDACKNGHKSFAITGAVKEPGTREPSMCGCIHDEIRKAFPELAHLIKWHLCSTKAIRVSLSDHNMAGKNGRRDTWFVGPDGKVWHGVSVGNSDVLHSKRTKR